LKKAEGRRQEKAKRLKADRSTQNSKLKTFPLSPHPSLFTSFLISFQNLTLLAPHPDTLNSDER
jgi:hypothetical protein